ITDAIELRALCPFPNNRLFSAQKSYETGVNCRVHDAEVIWNKESANRNRLVSQYIANQRERVKHYLKCQRQYIQWIRRQRQHDVRQKYERKCKRSEGPSQNAVREILKCQDAIAEWVHQVAKSAHRLEAAGTNADLSVPFLFN